MLHAGLERALGSNGGHSPTHISLANIYPLVLREAVREKVAQVREKVAQVKQNLP